MTSRIAGCGFWLATAATCCGPACGQAVTWDDLQGAVVETSTMLGQTVRRDGRTAEIRVQHDMNITIGPGSELYVVNNNTAWTPRGVRKSPPLAASSTLERPRTSKSRGGGHGVWLFSDGTLTYLRTYKGGASRNTYSFVRNEGGLACTASVNFAREKGFDGIVFIAAVDGLPLIILSSKQISSTCKITTQSQDTSSRPTPDK